MNRGVLTGAWTDNATDAYAESIDPNVLLELEDGVPELIGSYGPAERRHVTSSQTRLVDKLHFEFSTRAAPAAHPR
jgi:hypothetical protein